MCKFSHKTTVNLHFIGPINLLNQYFWHFHARLLGWQHKLMPSFPCPTVPFWYISFILMLSACSFWY